MYKDVYAIQSINGMKEKMNFLSEHKQDEWLRKFLYYAMNPLITYNLSENALRAELEKEIPSSMSGCVFFNDIFDCCDNLSRLRGIDNATLRQVHSFLMQFSGDELEIYIKLLSKTVRLGLTAKSINKVMDELIPEWEVQQAYPIDKYPVKEGTEFWLTQKLNGVRATYYNGELIARSGAPYKGLEHIIQIIEQIGKAGIVLDGELTLRDKGNLSDNEAFRESTGIINSDSLNKTGICYTIFDAVPLKDFENANPTMPYSKRRCILNEVSRLVDGDVVRVLPVLYHGTDSAKVEELLEKMVREDKEGLVMNLNVPYRRTRHSGILKIKRFYTMDLPIIGFEEGNGRLSGTLGALILKYKNNEVKVGTGFSDEDRKEFWEHREMMNGTLCEVKYKEISSDKKTGAESLQFPVFVRIRDDKSEVSYG